ncbi:MAG: c-type cytochrome domain-containing protein, partial [Planctomycetaceae bacterium]
MFAVLLPCVFLRTAVAQETPAEISYHTQIRPIFQTHCQGCHQPAKPNGQYVMTEFAALVSGGESEEQAVVPGKPDESQLLVRITPENGEASMPRGKPPLSEVEIGLVKSWIEQGAVDDSPASGRQRYSKDKPPVYSLPPVITSLDFSPDGSLLAVAGFHEVLLHKADGSGLVTRLIGLSE